MVCLYLKNKGSAVRFCLWPQNEKLIKNLIIASPFLNRKYKNLKNYFSTKNKLKNSSGQMKDDRLKNKLFDLISS